MHMLMHMLLRHDVIVLTNDPIWEPSAILVVACGVRPGVDRMDRWYRAP